MLDSKLFLAQHLQGGALVGYLLEWCNLRNHNRPHEVRLGDQSPRMEPSAFCNFLPTSDLTSAHATLFIQRHLSSVWVLTI